MWTLHRINDQYTNVWGCMGKTTEIPVRSHFADNIALFFFIQREDFQELEVYFAKRYANLDLLGEQIDISVYIIFLVWILPITVRTLIWITENIVFYVSWWIFDIEASRAFNMSKKTAAIRFRILPFGKYGKFESDREKNKQNKTFRCSVASREFF